MSLVSSAAMEEALAVCYAQGVVVERAHDLGVEVVHLRVLGCL